MKERYPEWELGPPKVLQVFATATPADEEMSGLALIYGQRDDLNGGPAVTDRADVGVPRSGARFRVVLNNLLDGETVEQFACAEGGGWSRDPETCAECPGKRCLDRDGDRIPDVVGLIDGIATFDCGAFRYVTGPDDGMYYPAGNQLRTTQWGLEGLGPAVVVEPRVTFPAGARCTMRLDREIADKSGDGLVWPAEAVVRFAVAAD
jgi:hypothetical protein